MFDSLSRRYHVLKDNFASMFSAREQAEVENFSAFGSTVTRGIKIAKRHERSLMGPGTGLLEFGGNARVFDWAAV